MGDWMEDLNRINVALELIEKNLLEPLNTMEMADLIVPYIHMSNTTFQKRFQIVTGYSFGEYIRNRRLYEAALELAQEDRKVLDIAIKYGYDSAEGFTKAFKRFHGITPSMARKRHIPITGFLPLKIKVSVEGGMEMTYIFETMDSFSLIGFEKRFTFPSSYDEIPQFYRDFKKKYAKALKKSSEPETEIEQAIVENRIGEYGAVIHDRQDASFRYLLGGMYQGGVVPEGMVLETFPTTEWLKFSCNSGSGKALQRLNTQVFQEWLPKHKEIKLRGRYNIEWGDSESSSIWVPVKKREDL